jgi:hypothetical protein
MKHMEDLGKRQWESLAQLSRDADNERRFDLVSSAVSNLESKLAEGDPKTGGTEVKQGRGVTDAVHRSPTPSPVVKLDNSRVDVSCKCNLNSCTMCVNASAIGENASESVRHLLANNYLSYSD